MQLRWLAGLHPATRFLLWLVLALALPVLVPQAQAVLALAMFGVLAISVPGSLGPTMRRLRWLLLTLLAAFAWTVPASRSGPWRGRQPVRDC